MHPTEFFLNPLTPELFMFGNKSLHSIDVSPKMRRDWKMSLSIKAYNEYLAAVKACAELKTATEAAASEIEALKAAAEAAASEIEALKAAATKKSGK